MAGDIKQKFGTSNQGITITLASLAESDTHVAGRESTAVVVADPVLDHIVSGKIKVVDYMAANKCL